MKTKIIFSVILCFYSASFYAQIPFSATYNFSGSGNDVSSFQYNGSEFEGLTFADIEKIGIISVSSNGNFRGRDWQTTSDGELIDTEKYISITINANNGYKFSISSVVFGIGRSANGPAKWEWRGNWDNYATTLNSYNNIAAELTNTNGVLTTPNQNSGWINNELNLIDHYFDIDSYANLRLYAYNAETKAGTGGFQGNITIVGTCERLPSTDPTLIINAPANNSIIYSKNIEINFETENFIVGIDGNLKLIHDNSHPIIHSSAEPVLLNNLSHGDHFIEIELIDNDNNSLDPPVVMNISFTCVHQSVYELLTSGNEIDDGRYLFTGIKNNEHYALGWQKSSNRNAVPVNVQNNIIAIFPAFEVSQEQDDENPYEIIITNTDDGFTLFDTLNNKYLRPASGNNNGLTCSNNKTYWNINIDTDGKANISCIKSDNETTYINNIMRFNAGSLLFNCYAGNTQSDIYIYKAIPHNTPKLNIFPTLLTFEDTFIDDISPVEEINVTGYNLIDIIEYELPDEFDDIFIMAKENTLKTQEEVLKIQFSPKDTITYSTTLTIKSNGSDDVLVSLQGKGIKAAPSFIINSPENGYNSYIDEIEIDITLNNFTLNTDGKIKHILNDNLTDYHVINKFKITNLKEGINNIAFSLVNMNNEPIEFTSPQTIEINYLPRKINITSPTEGQIIYDSSVDIVFVVENINLGINGKVKLSHNENIIGYLTDKSITLHDLDAGLHNIELELTDINHVCFAPPVKSVINFIIEPFYAATSLIDNINIFPNPASLHIYINNPDNYNIDNLYILNNLGQIVMDVGSNVKTIDISHLKAGFYFIKLTHAGSMKIFKFIKI